MPVELVAGATASRYYSQISAAVRTAMPVKDLVESLLDNRSSIPNSRRDIRDILDAVPFESNDELLRSIKRPGCEWFFAPAIITTANNEFSLYEIADHFAVVPATLTQATGELMTLLTFQEVVEQEFLIQTEEKQQLESEVEELEHSCIRAFETLRVRKSSRSLAKARVRAHQEAEDLRDAADDLLLVSAVCDALSACLKGIRQQIHTVQRRLENIIKILDSHRLKGLQSNDQALFLPRHIDLAFADLLLLTELDQVRQQRLLAAQVEQVTLEGLARIAGAQATNIEAVAERLSSAAPIPGAYVGGARYPSYETYYVLPPIADNVANELKKHILQLAPTALVFVGDCCASGLNVVRFKVNRPQTRNEALPGILQAELEKARTEPYSEIYSIRREDLAHLRNGQPTNHR